MRVTIWLGFLGFGLVVSIVRVAALLGVYNLVYENETWSLQFGTSFNEAF